MPSAADALDTRLPFAYALAALAGGVDAIAVLSLGDVFVSFMSGNTTLLGNAVAHLQGRHALKLALVIAAFLAGVVAGEVVAVRVDPSRRPQAVLATVTIGLAVAALLAWAAASPLATALCLAACMGLQNATVRRAGGIEVALTYVTGTLVRLGRAAAAALLGRGAWRKLTPIALLWCSFAAGAVGGGLAASANGAAAIGGAAVCAAVLAAVATIRPPTIAAPDGDGEPSARPTRSSA
jgi:uncharacterized membrane protein YoaK (UPF0700 family)